MPVLPQARDRPDDLRGDHVRAADRAAAPMWSTEVEARPHRHASSAIRNYWGARSAPSTAASGISTRSASTTTATPTRISRPSRKACYDMQCGGRPEPLGDGLRLPRRARRPGRQGDVSQRTPKGMSGFVFNTRRPIFADIRVREALASLFDFEWVNHNYLLRPLPPHRRAISRTRSCRPSAGRRTRASARCSRPSRTRCARTCSTAPGRRR